MRIYRTILALFVSLCFAGSAFAAGNQRNVIVFVADGLRHGSVNETDAPTLLAVRQKGVYFANSHSVIPTFTMPNGSAIATGHYLGDTGDFSNTVYVGYPVFNTGNFSRTAASPTPFLENDQVLSDVDDHANGNYLNEESLLSIARKNGYNTAAVGKLGPAAIQDAAQLKPLNKAFDPPQTVIIDDQTGSSTGLPLSQWMIDALAKAGLGTTPTPRNQPPGSNTVPGVLNANVGQQQWFANATTKAILPAFKSANKPFVLVYWSRDPDGSQHNQGDSLNSLKPGINGPTSLASVKNADTNLKQILDFINSDPALAANTDVFVTSDHGFATISRHDIDARGHGTASYSAQFTYKDATGNQEVNTGFLPPGFLAIDLAHALGLPLYDPDTLIADGKGGQKYMPVDPTIAQQTATTRQRPASGNGLLGASGSILDKTDAKVIVAANGGSDLIYVPDSSANRVRTIVNFLTEQDYVGAIFVADTFGHIPGALPLSALNLKGSAIMPQPTIVLGFKTFALDPENPLMSAVQIADTTLQQGQGMHGSMGRDNTFNNMAATGPDFKSGYVDKTPVSNADITPTLLSVLALKQENHGHLTGRVLTEALKGGPDPVPYHARVLESGKMDGKSTVLFYQQVKGYKYFDQACFVAVPAKAQASCR